MLEEKKKKKKRREINNVLHDNVLQLWVVVVCICTTAVV